MRTQAFEFFLDGKDTKNCQTNFHMHALLTKVGHFKIGINSGMAKISFFSRILWFIQKYVEDFREGMYYYFFSGMWQIFR